MKEQNDEEVDQLFKKAFNDQLSTRHDFREADWEAMEHLLRQQKSRRLAAYWFPWLSACAALILLFAGWMLYRPLFHSSTQKPRIAVVRKTARGSYEGMNSKLAAGSAQSSSGHLPLTALKPGERKGIEPGASARQLTKFAGAKKSYAILHGQHPPKSSGEGKQPRVQVQSAQAATSGGVNKSMLTVEEPKYSAQNRFPLPEGKPDKKDLMTADDQATPLTGNALAAGRTDKKELMTADDQATSSAGSSLAAGRKDKKDLMTADEKAAASSIISRSGNESLSVTGSAVVDTAAAGGNMTPAAGGAAGGYAPGRGANLPVFSITAMASSDVNGSSALSGSLGGDFGLLFSASINKWTFSTGLLYAIKPYQINSPGYAGAYALGSQPSGVRVNCRMADLSLDVSYRVYGSAGNAISLGTGLSSYIIFREDYRFTYGSYAYGPAGYTVANRNRNILSVLNLEATYQRKINSRFGLLVQPYLKIPLSPVGDRRARLQSTGIAAGLSWNIHARKQRH